MARPVSRMSVNRQESNIIAKLIDQSLNSCESMVQSRVPSRVQIPQTLHTCAIFILVRDILVNVQLTSKYTETLVLFCMP